MKEKRAVLDGVALELRRMIGTDLQGDRETRAGAQMRLAARRIAQRGADRNISAVLRFSGVAWLCKGQGFYPKLDGALC